MMARQPLMVKIPLLCLRLNGVAELPMSIGNLKVYCGLVRPELPIMRNCVGRLDRTNAPAEPIAVFTVYRCTDVEVQNCIAIDSDQDAYYSYAEMDGGFQTPATGGDGDRVNFNYCIALNLHIGALATSGNSGGVARDVVFNNSVFWNCTKPDGADNMIRGLRTQIKNCTFVIASH